MIRHEVENQVVVLSTFREILSGVINDAIRSDGSDHFNVPRTANAGDFGAERLGDLHSERTHASCRTIDQDLLARLNFSRIAQPLQGSESCHWYSSRLLKRCVFRLHYQFRLGSTGILGKGPTAPAEPRVSRLEMRNVAADCFDLTCHVTPGPIV